MRSHYERGGKNNGEGANELNVCSQGTIFDVTSLVHPVHVGTTDDYIAGHSDLADVTGILYKLLQMAQSRLQIH